MSSELDSKLKELLADYRHERTPSREVRARGLSALGARIAAGDPGLDLSGEGASAAGAKAGASLSVKVLGVTAVVLAGGVGWWWLAGQATTERPEPRATVTAPTERETQSAASPPEEIEKTQPAAQPEGATLPKIVAPSTEQAPSSVVKPPKTTGKRPQEVADERQAPDSTLRDEMELMSRGQSALQAGNAGAALDAFEQHRRRFPSGSLAAEREVKRVVALCQLGRRSEARATAERFAKAHPGSPLTRHALNACGGKP